MTAIYTPVELQIGIDVGSLNHSVAIGDKSKKYLKKKVSEGKRYQQAIRSIGRHLVRVIWSMIQNDRSYEIRKI